MRFGLLHSILLLLRRKQGLYRGSTRIISRGAIFHFVSITDLAVANHMVPVGQLLQTLSLSGVSDRRLVSAGGVALQLLFHGGRALPPGVRDDAGGLHGKPCGDLGQRGVSATPGW